jgi:6-phosphogluconolactonase (cycloisomerase 2 family)
MSNESDRRAFLRIAAGAATGVVTASGMPEIAAAEMRKSKEMNRSHSRGGHAHMQTNESRSGIIQYRWAASGALTEVERVATGGAGSGDLSPIYHTNRPATFVLHTFGPDHLRLMSIDAKGKLTARPEQYSVNTTDWTNRGPTMAVLSPDRKFLVVGTTFDESPTRKNPDGTLILVQIGTSAGLPSELSWLAVSPDDRFVFTANFGYSTVSSYRIDGNALSLAKDPAGPKVQGDGTFRAINRTVGSGPSDSWLTPDGAYLYQIYGNASKLVGCATQPDGSLKEITRAESPYNGPQGLAGF